MKKFIRILFTFIFYTTLAQASWPVPAAAAQVAINASSASSSAPAAGLPSSLARAEVIAQAAAHAKKLALPQFPSLSPLNVNEKPEHGKTAADRCINAKCLHHKHSFDKMNELEQLKEKMRNDEKRSLATGNNHAHMWQEQSRNFDPGLHRATITEKNKNEPFAIHQATINVTMNHHGRLKFSSQPTEHTKEWNTYELNAAVADVKNRITSKVYAPFAPSMRKHKKRKKLPTPKDWSGRPLQRRQGKNSLTFNLYSDKDVREELHVMNFLLSPGKELAYGYAPFIGVVGVLSNAERTHAWNFIKQQGLEKSKEAILIRNFRDHRQVNRYQVDPHADQKEKEEILKQQH